MANARPAGLRPAPRRPVCTKPQRARPPAAGAHGQQLQPGDEEESGDDGLPWDPKAADVYVAWDLDNKRPHDWSQLPELCSGLRDRLAGACGRIRVVAAFANRSTFDWVEGDDPELREEERLHLEAVLMEEAQDELRCELCGRRCKSLEDLQKHFKQLHQREHQKRMGGGSKKRTKKYLQSEKAERYRDAYHAAGLSRKLSRKGQTLKALLGELGVRAREVPTEKDSADNALRAWVDDVVAEMRERDEKRRKKAAQTAANRKGQKGGGRRQQQQQGVGGEEGEVRSERVLVVVSDDYGFRGLLQSVGSRGWWTVVVGTTPAKFEDVADAFIDWEDILPPPCHDAAFFDDGVYEFDSNAFYWEFIR